MKQTHQMYACRVIIDDIAEGEKVTGIIHESNYVIFRGLSGNRKFHEMEKITVTREYQDYE